MKTVLGTTAAFALVTAIFSHQGFPTPDDYALLVPRPTTGTQTVYDTLVKGLALRDCAGAFAQRNRAIYPSTNGLCTRIFDPSSGLRLRETQNETGQRTVETYPIGANAQP
ncbi:MAG TPA: hypothetical protein PKX87_07405 [Alphaproteobacteria bacterium]|nr:hypothetical protein [Alphaproteobacteria bacterium]